MLDSHFQYPHRPWLSIIHQQQYKWSHAGCFQSIREEMRDSENPQKLRKLMGDVYLNAIVNYDPHSMSELLLKQKIPLF